MRCATATPTNAPTTCAIAYLAAADQVIPPCDASASDTAGLKCAPEMGPNVRINPTGAAPVASGFASSAMATLPPASCSPMIPEPTTAASRKAVPRASATNARECTTAPPRANSTEGVPEVHPQPSDVSRHHDCGYLATRRPRYPRCSERPAFGPTPPCRPSTLEARELDCGLQ